MIEDSRAIIVHRNPLEITKVNSHVRQIQRKMCSMVIILSSPNGLGRIGKQPLDIYLISLLFILLIYSIIVPLNEAII